MSAYDFKVDLGADGRITARHYAPNGVDDRPARDDAAVGARDRAGDRTAAGDALGATYILAPGAGVGHDSSFIVEFGERLSQRGLDVVTFNFPFLERGSRKPDGNARLEHCYRSVIARVMATPRLATQPLIVGGKSMGGRIASYLAARRGGFAQPIAGLIFLGYPLHAPQRPEQLRVAHFPDIHVPMLFVQGTRDPFGTPLQLEPILSVLDSPAQIHKVMGGDHSFTLPKKWSGAEPQVFDEAAKVIVEWVRTEVRGLKD